MLFFYNGLNFVLRRGQEHRQLKISQFQFRTVSDPERPGQSIDTVEYREHGSKNRPGGRHQLNLENKTVVHYAAPEVGERCYVYLLRLYLSKLPESALQRDIFYMKPRDKQPASASEPWYSNRPMGHNALESFLKDILKEAGIDHTNRSNHSLRATSISRMYQKQIPEKLIMERSGHLSTEGMMSYQRTTAAQQKAVCNALSKPEKCNPEKKDGEIVAKRDVKPDAGGCPASTSKDSDVKSEENAAIAEEVMKRLAFGNLTNCTLNFTFGQ